MSDIREISNTEAFTYATGKLDAAAVLSASYLHDMYHAQNLGFIGAAYTAAHEAMELLLKVYLKRGLGMARGEAWGHDLGKLFMQWDEHEQGHKARAELSYQRDVLSDLKMNRILRAFQMTLQREYNMEDYRDWPPGLSEEQVKEKEHQYLTELTRDGSATVHEIVGNLDAILGAKNIIELCKPAHAGEIRGFPCAPKVWYPEELLSTEWGRFATATQQGESLGFVEAFIKREGTKLVFEGWRYLDERKLEKAGIVFHGPPAKMIDIARSLESIVHGGI